MTYLFVRVSAVFFLASFLLACRGSEEGNKLPSKFGGEDRPRVYVDESAVSGFSPVVAGTYKNLVAELGREEIDGKVIDISARRKFIDENFFNIKLKSFVRVNKDVLNLDFFEIRLSNSKPILVKKLKISEIEIEGKKGFSFVGEVVGSAGLVGVTVVGNDVFGQFTAFGESYVLLNIFDDIHEIMKIELKIYFDME